MKKIEKIFDVADVMASDPKSSMSKSEAVLLSGIRSPDLNRADAVLAAAIAEERRKDKDRKYRVK